jgi:phosphopantothenoylcysteine decarboxylase/phosphopantothenate--cysteine ligase
MNGNYSEPIRNTTYPSEVNGNCAADTAPMDSDFTAQAQAVGLAIEPPKFFAGKKILLGVCGSIAAYKAALIVRLLVRNGAEVRVIMTASAKDFVTPLTFSTLSRHEVISDFYASKEGLWHNHVELGLWADAFLIAPATASTIAKIANGISDSVLIATYLSARCPVFFAPAMDLDMWKHPATQRNIQFLQQIGNHLIPVGNGELASGLVGNGRLAEPEDIVAYLQQYFAAGKNGLAVAPPVEIIQPLHNKTVLITAGPTYEPIDPVRFIGNRSSGKMGIAIAEAAAQMGAKVFLLLGETNLRPTNPNIEVILTPTAESMYQQAILRFPQTNIAILSAAVADYKPTHQYTEKLKKKDEQLSITLEKTQDILATLGKQKRDGQYLVGFALETEHEERHALQKLEKKNLDLIVLNSLRDAGSGFQHDTNKVTVFDRQKNKYAFSLKSKQEVATDIIQLIIQKIPSLIV